jgi:hypothetical protein
VNSNRFELALERLQPSDWERFESLASTFLFDEFPVLRTLAWSSGDKGRDSILWQPASDPTVILQYSVTEYWETKIGETVALMKKHSPEASVLIYVTPLAVGPLADKLKQSLRKDRIFLDTRDRSWFVERANRTATTSTAAEELATAIVDPYLASRGVIETKGQALGSYDSRVALVYLQLQWEDDSRDKGLSKLAFDALVRSALRGTNSENRLSRGTIQTKISSALSAHDPTLVDQLTNQALARLTKASIRHWQKEDEFCLTHEETVRQVERLSALERQDRSLSDSLVAALCTTARQMGFKKYEISAPLVAFTRKIVEQVLLQRGHWFATHQMGQQLTLGEVESTATRELGALPSSSGLRGPVVPLVARSVQAVLTSPPDTLAPYVRALSDSYTLFAFLRQTPDVQSAIVKMFSHGEIWLDTSVILPVLAETLARPEARQYSNLLKAAKEAGSTLHATRGVLEEVERHINRASVCAGKTGADWLGKVPFLFSAFMWSGRPRGECSKWLGEFVGSMHPEDDLAEYLELEFGIKRGSLAEEAERADVRLRGAVQEVWRESHDRRHANDQMELDDITKGRLVDHDVENYLGVVERRKTAGVQPLGYSVWWLTLDRTAFCLHERLGRDYTDRPLHSPALSADFMNNYLSVGPARRMLSKQFESSLPIMMDLSVMQAVPTELIQVADTLRQELVGLPEHVIRRKIRDTLDAGKTRLGKLAHEGVAGYEKRLKDELLQSARESNGEGLGLPKTGCPDAP